MREAGSPFLFAAFALCLAGHLYLAVTLGLSVDEAHYALYAAHPALSYFDHPPLVGWVQIPMVWLGGSDGLLRIVPLGLLMLAAFGLYRFSLLVGLPNSTSAFSLALLLLSPIHHLLALALVPDTLLLPITLWVMALTWQLSTDLSNIRLWLWLGVALGLSGLAKYTGIFLAFSSAVLLLKAHGLTLLRARGLWLAMLVAAVLVSPVLVWNAQNNWISFAYQLNHADGNQAWQWGNVLKFDAVQLLGYGTLPLLGLIVFLFKRSHPTAQNLVLRPAPHSTPHSTPHPTLHPALHHAYLRLLWCCLAFGLPTLLLGAYSSGKGSGLPHWTATGWTALMPLAAWGVHWLWHARQATRILTLGLGGLQAISIGALGIMMATGGQWGSASPRQSIVGPVGNPFADLHDWQDAAKAAQALQLERGAQALAVSNWTLASRLAWYARPSRVLALDGKNKQFDIWFGRLVPGQTLIWMNGSQMPQPTPTSCDPAPASTFKGQHASFDFYLCRQP